MNWLVILVTIILAYVCAEVLIGDIGTKGVVAFVTILITALVWACYGLYIVAGG